MIVIHGSSSKSAHNSKQWSEDDCGSAGNELNYLSTISPSVSIIQCSKSTLPLVSVCGQVLERTKKEKTKIQCHNCWVPKKNLLAYLSMI